MAVSANVKYKKKLHFMELLILEEFLSVECSPLVRETWVQFPVRVYTKDFKNGTWYLLA